MNPNSTTDPETDDIPSELKTFPYPLTPLPMEKTEQYFLTLRKESLTTNKIPVLLGDITEIKRVRENMTINPQEPDTVLSAAEIINGRDWLSIAVPELLNPHTTSKSMMGKWPKKNTPSKKLSAFKTRVPIRYRSTQYITWIPTDQAWKIPAYLQQGGWNAYPDPAHECAVARYFEEKYGAEYTATTGTDAEYIVAHPPVTPKEAEVLALEHYSFCPDTVEQGADSIRNLAAMLLNSSTWMFWWD